jgi:hypothetical protein
VPAANRGYSPECVEGEFSEVRLLGGCAGFPCGAHYGSMKHCRKEDTLDHTARHVPSGVLNVRAWHPDLVDA